MEVHLCLFSYGGVEDATLDALIGELTSSREHGVRFLFDRISHDALISRSRSAALSRFYERTRADVCFMLDRDVSFQPGDLCRTAIKAEETGALVAGLYSVRRAGTGVASRLAEDGAQFEPGGQKVHEASLLGGGFLAIPRSAVWTLVNEREKLPPELALSRFRDLWEPPVDAWDFFRPAVRPWPLRRSPLDADVNEYLSEDWAFSARMAAVGVARYCWELPVLVHHGKIGYSVLDVARSERPPG